MEKSEQINDLAAALASAQAELKDICKDAQAYKYKYADLSSVLEVARPTLSKHGISVTQLVGDGNCEGDRVRVSVETVMMHSSGQWISSQASMEVEEKKGMSMAQNAGSVITYLRRYAYTAMVGITQQDDDARKDNPNNQGAQGRTQAAPPQPDKAISRGQHTRLEAHINESAKAAAIDAKDFREFIKTQVKKLTGVEHLNLLPCIHYDKVYGGIQGKTGAYVELQQNHQGAA